MIVEILSTTIKVAAIILHHFFKVKHTLCIYHIHICLLNASDFVSDTFM